MFTSTKHIPQKKQGTRSKYLRATVKNHLLVVFNWMYNQKHLCVLVENIILGCVINTVYSEISRRNLHVDSYENISGAIFYFSYFQIIFCSPVKNI